MTSLLGVGTLATWFAGPILFAYGLWMLYHRRVDAFLLAGILCNTVVLLSMLLSFLSPIDRLFSI